MSNILEAPPTSPAERYQQAREGVIRCWSLIASGKALEAVQQTTGFTLTHVRNLDRARRQATPQTKQAFLVGAISITRLIALAALPEWEQAMGLEGSKYRKRGTQEIRAMLHALLSMPEAQRDEVWKGAKEALGWVLGMGGSVAGMKLDGRDIRHARVSRPLGALLRQQEGANAFPKDKARRRLLHGVLGR